jgi:hypothetical protein
VVVDVAAPPEAHDHECSGPHCNFEVNRSYTGLAWLVRNLEERRSLVLALVLGKFISVGITVVVLVLVYQVCDSGRRIGHPGADCGPHGRDRCGMQRSSARIPGSGITLPLTVEALSGSSSSARGGPCGRRAPCGRAARPDYWYLLPRMYQL